jgi:hypothetical protein
MALAMDPGQHERIRKLYEDLSDIGEEARERASALPEPVAQRPLQLQSVSSTPSVAVKRTTTPLSIGGSAATAKPLGLTNPFLVVGAALTAIAASPLEFFGVGVVFVAVLGAISDVLIGWNTDAGTIGLTRIAPRLILLPLVAYVLGRWIRIGRSRGTKLFTLKFFPGDIAIIIGSVLIVVLLADRVIDSDIAPAIRYAAFFTKYWPLHGPYPSMVAGATGLVLFNMPLGTTFVEPFVYTLAMLPAVLFVPLILNEYRGFGTWLHFLFRTLLIVLALIVATIPFAILNLNLADWTRRMVAIDRHSSAFALATICYMQIVIVGATIGECCRRSFGPNP